MGKLVRVYPGRPVFVGGVCISMHDSWHLLRRAQLRRNILKAPPGSKRRLMDAITAYRTFEGKEREWYAQYGLVPPDPGRVCAKLCKVGHILEPGQRPCDCRVCEQKRRKDYWRRTHPKRPPSMTKAAIQMRAWRAKRKRVGIRAEG